MTAVRKVQNSVASRAAGMAEHWAICSVDETADLRVGTKVEHLVARLAGN